MKLDQKVSKTELTNYELYYSEITVQGPLFNSNANVIYNQHPQGAYIRQSKGANATIIYPKFVYQL